MSEYQFYEFTAVDGPISDEGLRYATSCSSRAEVSRVRWRNTYSFGDFKGSVDTLLKYYDAHFYIANWGTVRFGLAFPSGVLSREALEPYLWGRQRNEERTLTFKETGERCMVWWDRHVDGGWGWTEGDGVLDQLVGIREELLQGDFRSLFLGWLTDFHPAEWQDSKAGKVLMPPIPTGLKRLSSAQAALIKQFPVDPDALAVAAEFSPANQADRIPMSAVLERLSTQEMRALLGRVAEGGGSRVVAELNRLTFPPKQPSAVQSRMCGDFATTIIEAQSIRKKAEAEAAAAARRLAKERRRKHLASVMLRADLVWSGLAPLMDQKIASAYDQVAAQLHELRDAYLQAGDTSEFTRRIGEFRNRYSNRPAMMRRIEKLL